MTEKHDSSAFYNSTEEQQGQCHTSHITVLATIFAHLHNIKFTKYCASHEKMLQAKSKKM